MEWEQYTLSQIRSGKTAEGTKLLLLFLKDVKEKLNVFQPNAHCNTCLADYYKKLTKNIKMAQSENTKKSKYMLLEKRNNIQVEFGGNDFLNNDNITDERAVKLIKRFKQLKGNSFKMSDLFAVYPETNKTETDAKAKEKAEGKAKEKADAKVEEPAIKPMPNVSEQADKLNLDD